MTKAELREQARIQAELKNAPIHLLISINNMATQILAGLDGGKVIEGVQVPALHLPPKHEKWCREQLAKIIRWTAANMERYGFDFRGKYPSNFWESGNKKIGLIGQAVRHYARDCEYDEQCIVQMIVAEVAWVGVRVRNKDKSREARWLSQTLDTFTSKFIDEGDKVDWAATDVYMAIAPILEGREPYRKLDFNSIQAWSTI